MRITTAETFPVALPFREPYITSKGTIDHRVMVIFRVEDEQGIFGHGDAVPMTLRDGPGLDRVLLDLDRECSAAIADREVERRRQRSVDLVASSADAGVTPSALAAVDMALIDLLGRATGTPAWRLLANRRIKTVPATAPWVAGSPPPSPPSPRS